MAAGSLAEMQTQVLLACLGFVGQVAADAFMAQHRGVSMQLQALRKALQRRVSTESRRFHPHPPVPRSPLR